MNSKLQLRTLQRAVKRAGKRIAVGGASINSPSFPHVCARGAVAVAYGITTVYIFSENNPVYWKSFAMEIGFENWGDHGLNEVIEKLGPTVYNRYKRLGERLRQNAQESP